MLSADMYHQEAHSIMNEQTRDWTPVQTFISCVTLGKWFKLSNPNQLFCEVGRPVSN